ncbi:hypothetical protein [Actimicrobium antarcticum]|uniref:Uncharacterized protein n=1 Tax=Actimicrobium antarcticum TaxID=1051899 RepID=A0ABP7T331_9BURK
MMKSPKFLLGTAVLVFANFAGAQTLSVPAVGAGINSNGGVNAPVAVTPMSPATPAVGVGASGAVSVAPAADPYVQKRAEDAAAKSDYKMKKDMAKEEYKEDKAQAKSDMKAEKRSASRERKARLAADAKIQKKDDTIN